MTNQELVERHNGLGRQNQELKIWTFVSDPKASHNHSTGDPLRRYQIVVNLVKM